jgi:hypothetical protein
MKRGLQVATIYYDTSYRKFCDDAFWHIQESTQTTAGMGGQSLGSLGNVETLFVDFT